MPQLGGSTKRGGFESVGEGGGGKAEERQGLTDEEEVSPRRRERLAGNVQQLSQRAAEPAAAAQGRQEASVPQTMIAMLFVYLKKIFYIS